MIGGIGAACHSRALVQGVAALKAGIPAALCFPWVVDRAIAAELTTRNQEACAQNASERSTCQLALAPAWLVNARQDFPSEFASAAHSVALACKVLAMTSIPCPCFIIYAVLHCNSQSSHRCAHTLNTLALAFPSYELQSPSIPPRPLGTGSAASCEKQGTVLTRPSDWILAAGLAPPSRVAEPALLVGCLWRGGGNGGLKREVAGRGAG